MTVWAVALSLLALAALPFRNVIMDMCQREARTRLGQMPVGLLRLAARRLPREWRDDFLAEWLAELNDIRRATSEVPVTGLVRQVLFALSLLVHARAVAREFTGEKLPWIPRPLPRGISLRRALGSARQRITRSLRLGLTPASPRVSGGTVVSLRWPVALVAVALLAAASTFFITSLTQEGGGPKSPGIPSAAAGTLDPHYLSITVPVGSSELLADDTGPSAALLLTSYVKADLEKLAPGRSAGFVLAFAPSPTEDIAQAITAADQVVGILRTKDPEEFKYAAGEGFWTDANQLITIRVFLLKQPTPRS